MNHLNRSQFYVLSLVVILSTSFSCFGMKKGKELGCCGAVKKTAQFAVDSACDIMRADDSGKDIEMGKDASEPRTRCCLTSFGKKRAVLVTALLALSVAGGGTYFALENDAPTPSAEAAQRVTPSIPLAPPPSIPLSNPLTNVSHILWGEGASRYGGYYNHRDPGILAVGDSIVVDGNVTETRTIDYYRMEGLNRMKPPCIIFKSKMRLVPLREESMPDWSKCATAEESRGEFNVSTFHRGGDLYFAVGDDSGPDGTCQVQCYDPPWASWYGQVCRSKEARARYFPRARVNPKPFNDMTCRFNEQAVSPPVKGRPSKHQSKTHNATRPAREKRPKQAKHRGNKR